MNHKILKIGAAVPLFIVGILGFASSAKAANFTTDSQLNLASAVQVNAGFLGPDPTGEGVGDGDVFFDILFAPTLPNGFFGDPSAFTGFMDSLVDSNNRVLDVDDDPDRDATTGDLGMILATAGNTGAFLGISTGDEGLVRDFDNSPDETFGFDDDNFFLEIGGFRFTLKPDTVEFEPEGQLLFAQEFQPDDTNAEVDFDALGEVIDLSDGTTAHVRYDFTAQFLFDNGDGGDPAADDFITAIGSVSGSIIVEEKDIPEPSSILSMLVLGGGFLSQGLLRKKVAGKS